jgi:hypothetical protein
MALQLRLARLEDNVLGDADRSRIPSVPEHFELRTPADVLKLLQWQIAAVARDRRSSAVERARAIGYLGALSLKAIEADNLVARLEALEAALKRRARDGSKSA